MTVRLIVWLIGRLPAFGWVDLRLALRNRDFLFFLGANLMIQYVFLAMSSSIPFYAKYVLRIQAPTTLGGVRLDTGLQNSLLLAAAFLAALPAMALWLALARRYGAWRALRAAALLGAATALFFFFPHTFATCILGTTAFGISLAGLLMLTNPLIADITDEDEVLNGARREGMFFGMNGLVIRLAFVIQGILTAVVFTLTGYVNPSAGVPAVAVRPVVSAQQRRLTPLIDAIALSEGVDPTLVHAVISQESRYHPRAGSPAGAVGLMTLRRRRSSKN